MELSVDAVFVSPMGVYKALQRFTLMLLSYIHGFMSNKYASNEQLKVLELCDSLKPFALPDMKLLQRFTNMHVEVSKLLTLKITQSKIMRTLNFYFPEGTPFMTSKIKFPALLTNPIEAQEVSSRYHH